MRKLQFGFSLLETMAALAVILLVTGIVMSKMIQMMNTQSKIANRTEMHAGVRSATELLQQALQLWVTGRWTPSRGASTNDQRSTAVVKKCGACFMKGMPQFFCKISEEIYR